MTPDILRRIVSVDPRAIAASLLSYLIEVVGARGGVVLARRKGSLLQFAERTSLQGVGLALQAWDENLTELSAGLKSVSGDTCLLPVILNGFLVGAVWLEGVGDARACELGDVALPLAAAIEAPTPPLDASMTMDEEEYLKRRTLLLLNENEWNLARVARMMRITRRTIYLRLDRWGIERRRISKDPRRRPEPSGA